MNKKNKEVNLTKMISYLCFLFSFPILTDSLMSITYTINVQDYVSAIYFIFQSLAGIFLSILGITMIISSKCYDKLDEGTIRRILNITRNYSNQLNSLKTYIVFIISVLMVTLSFQFLGIMYGILSAIIVAAIFFRILMKFLK